MHIGADSSIKVTLRRVAEEEHSLAGVGVGASHIVVEDGLPGAGFSWTGARSPEAGCST